MYLPLEGTTTTAIIAASTLNNEQLSRSGSTRTFNHHSALDTVRVGVTVTVTNTNTSYSLQFVILPELTRLHRWRAVNRLKK